ncbi:hypothetical protein KFE98_06200 [bacterium SCSIO 12741]|nr:hypothetical protein KFE98_06200 [bacterium SCSIO 12741]
MQVSWSRIGLLFLLVVALIGTLLRGQFLFSLPFQYGHLVHAHSHVAFQGWIYPLMLLFLTHLYLDSETIKKGRYALQFKWTIPLIIAILASFSLQGYALYSIIFSTVFQGLNYWFIFRFLGDLKKSPSKKKDLISIHYIKTGLWLGLLSTLVPFGIGAMSAKGLGGSEAYQSLVYTFLHLQYNGWFLFVALGLFYRLLEIRNIPYHRPKARHGFILFALAALPAITLSLLGMSFAPYLQVPATLSTIMLLAGAIYFVLSVQSVLVAFWISLRRWSRVFIGLFLFFFVLKTVLQSLSVVPIFQDYAFTSKSIILAYLHLSLIGVISFLFLGLLIELGWITTKKLVPVGLTLFLTGFCWTEMLLVFDGLHWIFYPSTALFIGSAMMALGIFLIVIHPTSKTAYHGKI